MPSVRLLLIYTDAVALDDRAPLLAEHLAAQEDQAHLVAERQLVTQLFLARKCVQDAAYDALPARALKVSSGA